MEISNGMEWYGQWTLPTGTIWYTMYLLHVLVHSIHFEILDFQ